MFPGRCVAALVHAGGIQWQNCPWCPFAKLATATDAEVSDSAVLSEFIENFDKPEGFSAVMDEKHESDEYVCGTWTSRWPRGMCRERTSTVKFAGGFTHFYLKDMNKLASWPDFQGSMYGTRDAASIWGDTWSDVLKGSSMKVGTACPAFFLSCDGDLRGLCHGDDFCVVARQKQLKNLEKSLRNGLR